MTRYIRHRSCNDKADESDRFHVDQCSDIKLGEYIGLKGEMNGNLEECSVIFESVVSSFQSESTFFGRVD